MLAVHEHFRLDNRDQPRFLAQRGIAGQRLRVSLNATSAGNTLPHDNHRTPLGKTGSHLKIFLESVAQSIQTFGYFLAAMPCHILCTDIHFDTGNDSCIFDGFYERGSVILVLADGLVVKDCSANALFKAGSRHNHLSIGATSFFCLGNP